ncbi:hypothetical protein CR164_05735 [Prosthecochloris marina]|uniref:Uncharacterized protein n=1 Tax=Prosthecochloris marina TaxID=2017681 RepID=A0A317T6Z5_9CHLB|nr:hypothetical protein [Prosthecochloris marina]PWW82489.1 hypothetical protein CR164_05735 [Prosthecochloris marina]
MSDKAQSASHDVIKISRVNDIWRIFSAIATPLLIFYSLSRVFNFSDDLFESLLTFTVCFSFVLLLVFIIVREVIFARKEKYANITGKLHFCFHLIRDIESFLNELDPSALSEKDGERVFTGATNGLITVLDCVATIFSMLTGTRCRATIKAIYEKDKKLYVRTLARDTDSYEHNSEKDKERSDKNQDAIEENEDFELLYSEKQPGQNYFFCNDLMQRRNYKTSSFKVYGEPKEEMGFYERITGKGWTLPYRSAIVWPIQQRKNRHFDFDEVGCIGFLAVDSESRGVFKKSWDTWLGAGVADALFHPLNTMFKVVENKNEENANETAE